MDRKKNEYCYYYCSRNNYYPSQNILYALIHLAFGMFYIQNNFNLLYDIQTILMKRLKLVQALKQGTHFLLQEDLSLL